MDNKFKSIVEKLKGKGVVGQFIANCLTDNGVVFQFLRYCVVGGVAFVFDYCFLQLALMLLPTDWFTNIGVFATLIELDLSVLLATTVGFVVGIAVNYFLSLLIVFIGEGDREKGMKFSAIVIFIVVGVIGLVLTAIGMQAGTALFGKAPLAVFLVKVVVTLIVLVWNYLGRKLLIFK